MRRVLHPRHGRVAAQRSRRGPMVSWMSEWAVARVNHQVMGGDDTALHPARFGDRAAPYPGPYRTGWCAVRRRAGWGSGRAKCRSTLADRVALTAELVAGEPDEPWLLWCGLNGEADAPAARIPGADPTCMLYRSRRKERGWLLGFADGDYRVLITAVNRLAGTQLSALRADGVRRTSVTPMSITKRSDAATHMARAAS